LELWTVGSFNWNRVLVLAEKSYYGVDPKEIYKSYTGTNKIVVGDNVPVSVGNYGYSLYNDIFWNKFTVDPV